MIDLKLSFNSETILRLTAEQFKQLSTTGETITDFAPAKDYWIDVEFSRMFLSTDDSISSFLFESEQIAAIDTFIKNSYLIHFFPKTGKIKLIKDYDKPLAELLPMKCNEVIDIPVINKVEFKEQQRIFLDPLNEDSPNTLISTGNFKGQIACCECGEAGCSSAYLWAEKNIGLSSFHILAGGLGEVRLFPFRIS